MACEDMASLPEAAHKIDRILASADSSIARLATGPSDTQRRAEFTKLCSLLGDARDTLQAALGGDKNTLDNAFGGDFRRLARLHAIIDTMEPEVPEPRDARWQQARATCVAVEAVLFDRHGTAVQQAVTVEKEVLAARRRSSLEALNMLPCFDLGNSSPTRRHPTSNSPSAPQLDGAMVDQCRRGPSISRRWSLNAPSNDCGNAACPTGSARRASAASKSPPHAPPPIARAISSGCIAHAQVHPEPPPLIARAVSSGCMAHAQVHHEPPKARLVQLPAHDVPKAVPIPYVEGDMVPPVTASIPVAVPISTSVPTLSIPELLAPHSCNTSVGCSEQQEANCSYGDVVHPGTPDVCSARAKLGPLTLIAGISRQALTAVNQHPTPRGRSPSPFVVQTPFAGEAISRGRKLPSPRSNSTPRGTPLRRRPDWKGGRGNTMEHPGRRVGSPPWRDTSGHFVLST